MAKGNFKRYGIFCFIVLIVMSVKVMLTACHLE